MKKIIFVLGLCIGFFNLKAQDTIWLKTGKSIIGRISSFADNTVKIKTANGEFVYKLDEIKSLKYNGPAKEMNQSLAKIVPDNKGNKSRKDEIEAKPVKTEQ